MDLTKAFEGLIMMGVVQVENLFFFFFFFFFLANHHQGGQCPGLPPVAAALIPAEPVQLVA